MRRRPKVLCHWPCFVTREVRYKISPNQRHELTLIVLMQEHLQQQPPDLCDEDLQLLSPIQTSASAPESQKAASKQQKAPKPRKPRLPAWKAEAIRQEAELAIAHFNEVCDRAALYELTMSQKVP